MAKLFLNFNDVSIEQTLSFCQKLKHQLFVFIIVPFEIITSSGLCTRNQYFVTSPSNSLVYAFLPLIMGCMLEVEYSLVSFYGYFSSTLCILSTFIFSHNFLRRYMWQYVYVLYKINTIMYETLMFNTQSEINPVRTTALV